MLGFPHTDSNIQSPTSDLGEGGKVSLNAIVSSLSYLRAPLGHLSQLLWLQDGDVSKDSRG